MFEPFLIALRESLQCAVILAIISGYRGLNAEEGYGKSAVIGVLGAFIAGFPAGYLPYLSKNLWTNETWTYLRYISESALFYLGLVFVFVKLNPSSFMRSTGFFFLGFFIFFFEARALGFLLKDIGTMRDMVYTTLVMGAVGTIAGFTPLVFLRKHLMRIPLRKAFVLSSLLMFIGALQFAFGGVGEIEKENIMILLQRGFLNFISEGVRHAQSMLLITDHSFMKIPFAGLGRFLSGDKTAMTLAVIFILIPPLFILIHLFSRPDPVVSDIHVGALRRQKIAFFRRELIYQTMPVLFAFMMLVTLVHAANISLNSLFDPPPLPVREGENESVLKIPISDKSGDITDKKLRKYVYYYGNKRIIFLAVLKPDGSVGIALDQCEICRPADWNKSAQGYAQRGEKLICKYCVTPIATSTVNSPGGCNPIPLTFTLEGNNIIIALDDLISTFKKAETLEKKGTHL